PILTAVSGSARQLYLLLRCINFAEKAHVQISEAGLKFSVDEASVMEGSAFLSKDLFTSYTFRAPPADPNAQASDSENEDAEDPTAGMPTFQISLPSLLETLQIFGLTDPSTSGKPPWSRSDPTSTAFSNNVLGMNNLCRIVYTEVGAPLTIILTESTIRTSCHLTTYEPAFSDEIPFDRSALAFKTIMRGSWLGDAVAELSSTAPEKLTLWARIKRKKPYFALSSSGTLGSARVEFNNDDDANTTHGRNPPPPQTHNNPPTTTTTQTAPGHQSSLLETFQLGSPSSHLRASYKFALIQRAARAMSVASKVSVRIDDQGVLSLQFMITMVDGGSTASTTTSVGNESGGSGGGSGNRQISYVDFRFVPLVEEGEGSEQEEEEHEDGGVEDTLMRVMGEDDDDDDD
ncbi:Rad1-domain-containing protein, partial [Periconia macrospinosa]